ncbi:reverse transcriptase [Hirsutella rhossiliensis]|uniref:Reverse transcriptase n=1 Tax=Hirsutella rhossiliensis TaxID=111463 RepID=A0A9P8N1W9_9HYPO|nr:reverse transcriptase [Hirsutella rhossiliensis]KAH0965349.1 reverse transcriptase [Hirsutella rhossiliensis]
MNRGTVPAAKSARTAIGNIRKAIESDMRKSQRQETWKCAAVVTDARNPDRIKILCRDQTELKQVKEAAQKTVTSGARRTAVLDAEGNVLPGAAEALGAENYVTIAKITWLSNREKAKAYGSMVIYVTKESDAQRLLDGVWFDVAGESACTNVFERRVGPIQCFNCQEMGHKAFSCKKPQRCGRCAKAEHHHRECKETVPKYSTSDFDRPRFSC